jgi:hypothetical protein
VADLGEGDPHRHGGYLAILITLPWIFMWTTMAAWCAPMMGAMRDMMGPGMMR